jgi:phosphomethylpyrimidine synthase
MISNSKKKNKILKQISQDEVVDGAFLEAGIGLGTIVIPLNNRRGRAIKPLAIGKGLRTKVNANLGGSPDIGKIDLELEKLRVACAAGADTIMDLSVSDNADAIRRAVIENSPVAVGTVPIYQAAIDGRKAGKSLIDLSAKEIFAAIEKHLKDGVDFITVHCGITRAGVERIRNRRRLTGVVSRGGTLTIEWMHHNRKENPLYENYDELLALAKDFGVTLSLGDGLRPGSIADATDRAQIQELLIIGELVDRARAAGVFAMVEGPGHIPIDEIEANMILQKAICKDAPFYVLGPLVTDIACGYDHITSAIGGALAARYGADFLCYVTPSEHLGLPTVEDVHQGVIAARIAAHAGDIGKGLPRARQWDAEISQARSQLAWKRMIELSIDPERAKKIYESTPSKTEGVCTMCGEFCAVRKSIEILENPEKQDLTTKNTKDTKR